MTSTNVQKLSEVKGGEVNRVSTQMGEVDRVLGGGIVPGSVILIGGDPGIGKSTLLLQVVEKMAQSQEIIGNILYVSGEESPEQIKIRAERIGAISDNVQIMAETSIERIESAILGDINPKLVVIDSIQTMYDDRFPSTPGSIVQVRETAIRIQQIAKTQGIPIILIGHITKEGNIAGPRTLEHLVDVVLYLEGDQERDLRILRGVKNRFGSVNEVGIFSMQESGMQEVSNPGSFLISERVDAPGTVLTAIMEGTRPILVEVQALTTETNFGYPKRTASGFDLNRLNLLIAVLQKRAGINLSNEDVYVNIVGGLKVKDPAVDGAVCVALVSAHRGVAVANNVCVVGEVGLAGEIRTVQNQLQREKEVKTLGYTINKKSKNIADLIKGIFR